MLLQPLSQHRNRLIVFVELGQQSSQLDIGLLGGRILSGLVQRDRLPVAFQGLGIVVQSLERQAQVF
jgi:hypothetical protein